MSESPVGQPVVVRRQVEARAAAADYREDLRFDFWYSCAYCSLAELEALAIGFEIDHYLPRRTRPELVAVYANLYWCCRACNRLKGDFEPTEGQRTKGLYVIRVDKEDPRIHFALQADGIAPLTTTGEFNLELLRLNRPQLQRVRSLRSRWRASREISVHGIRALGEAWSRLDQVDPGNRPYVLRLRREAVERFETIRSRIDKSIRHVLQSPFLDPDPESRASTQRRRDYLREIGVLGPDPLMPQRPHGARRRGSEKRRKR